MKTLAMNLASLFLILAIILLDKGNSVWAYMLGGVCTATCIHMTVWASHLVYKDRK